MASPVTVRDTLGNDFHCSRKQWETIYAPRRGYKLVADEDGRPTPAAARSTSKAKSKQSED